MCFSGGDLTPIPGYMAFGSKNNPDAVDLSQVGPDGQDPRRSSPRQTTDTLACQLGAVVDISTTGVRIACKGKPPFSEGAISTINFAFKGGQLPVSVQERWRKRKGFFGHYEIGLKFVSNSPNVIKAIESLVKFGFLCPDAVAGGKPQPSQKTKPKPKLKVSIDLPNYYAVLNVSKDADGEQVHTAYRKLARKFHPDTNKAPGAQDRFIAICEAYKVLSDIDQRKSYDLRQAG